MRVALDSRIAATVRRWLAWMGPYSERALGGVSQHWAWRSVCSLAGKAAERCGRLTARLWKLAVELEGDPSRVEPRAGSTAMEGYPIGRSNRRRRTKPAEITTDTQPGRSSGLREGGREFRRPAPRRLSANDPRTPAHEHAQYGARIHNTQKEGEHGATKFIVRRTRRGAWLLTPTLVTQIGVVKTAGARFVTAIVRPSLWQAAVQWFARAAACNFWWDRGEARTLF